MKVSLETVPWVLFDLSAPGEMWNVYYIVRRRRRRYNVAAEDPNLLTRAVHSFALPTC